MTSTGGQANSGGAARAPGATRYRWPAAWAGRSLATSCGAGRPATDGSCSCGPGRRSDRSRPARSPRRCAGHAGEQGSPRWDRTDCATPWPARWSVRRSRWCRSRRCYGITACRAPRSTHAWTSSSCGRWRRRGRKVHCDQRAESARAGLPAVAPGARVQAGTRRPAASAAGGLPAGSRRGDDHQRHSDRVGAAAGACAPQPLGPPPGHPPRGRLIEGAQALRSPLRAATHEALFGLLATSGMRIGEAIGLQRGDVDLGAGLVTIHQAKFNRARLVPLHPSTTAALRRYTAERDRLCPRPRSQAFFLSSAGTPPHRSGVEKTFRTIPTAIGVRTATVHPRVHDLRHSFAVDTLIRWHRRGVNVEERIGALSIYLGHVSPADTYWYLSASPQLMALAAERLHTRFGAGQ